MHTHTHLLLTYVPRSASNIGRIVLKTRAADEALYRVTLVVEYLVWVDLDLECSTILLGR